MTDLKTEWVFPNEYSSREELEEDVEILDATTLSKISDCPRYFYYRYERNLRPHGKPRRMWAGIVMHEALDFFYSTGATDEEGALEVLRRTWHENDVDEGEITKRNSHITLPHLEVVLKNYFDHWLRERTDPYTPLSGFQIDDLDLSDVLAAKFRTTPDGTVLFGESSIVMRFTAEDLGGEGEDFVLAGKPDLPVQNQSGNIYIMDHKTTSSYISDWYFNRHRTSSKLRGYMAMMGKLIRQKPSGAMLNVLYVGDRASSPDFGGTRFTRYRFPFSWSHVKEALTNQYEWSTLIDRFRERGEWPQGCSSGCKCEDLCTAIPETREQVMQTNYKEDPRDFFSI